MKRIAILLYLLSTLLFSQVVETDKNEDNHFKIYSAKVELFNNYKDVKEFIKELDTNLLSYIRDGKLDDKVFNFYYNGNYRGIKYLSHYLQEKLNSKALSLTKKEKLKICNIIKKYNTDSPDGDNCIGNIIYQNSNVAFWNYLPHYIKGYIKEIQNGKNLNLYFYSGIYFLIFFSLAILLIVFIKSILLFFKDIYSLIFIKRPHYESFFWTLAFILISFYLASFDIILLFLLLVLLSFVYLGKKFIPLLIFLILMPLLIEFLSGKYQVYDVKVQPIDKLSLELIHTDILPTRRQLNRLKDRKSFFSNIAIANTYKKEGDFKTSLKYYKYSIKIKKTGFLYNNIANIYALRGDYKKAIDYYNEAKYYNDDTLYFYNMSKVYYRLKDKEKAEYYRKLANNLNKKLVKKLDEISTFNINRFFIDKFPNYKNSIKIYSEIYEQKDSDKYLDLFKLNHKRYLIDLFIASMFYLFLFIIFRKKLKSSYCQRCGDVFNNLDITERHNSFELCASCYSMMNTRSSLKKEDLIKKEKEIRIKKIIKRYRDFLINAILPGSFYLYKFDSYLGVLFLLWHSYFLVVVFSFYDKWNKIVNNNFFNFSIIIFIIIEVSLYGYTYLKLIKRR